MGPKARRPAALIAAEAGTTSGASSPSPASTKPAKRARKPVVSDEEQSSPVKPVSKQHTINTRESIESATNDSREMFEDNLTLEACRERLRALQDRNEELEQHSTFFRSDVRLNLETQIEQLQSSVRDAITAVSDLVAEQTSNNFIKGSSKSRPPRSSPFARKVFKPQESPLSRMLVYGDENYKTLFNIGVVCLVLWGSAMVLDDIDRFGTPNYDLLMWGIVNDFEPFFKKWFLLILLSFSIIPLAHFWAESRRMVTGVFLGAIYVSLQIWMFTFSAKVVFSQMENLSMPLAMGFMVEQTRMSMKIHSYLREKVMWKHFHGEYACEPISSLRIKLFDIAIPEINYFFGEISKFGFFLVVPTLLFREKYPRTLRIRWSFVIQHTIESIAIVYYSFLIYRAVTPQFYENAGAPTNWKLFARQSFKCMGPAMATMVLAHYLVLHSVQHVGAELTRFADRGFYQDWWNSRTFSVFYRKWNGVVHDFIHCYLYTDMVEFLRLGKLPALLLSFIISAVVHEYLICVAMGFFLPILGILFTGPGLAFILLTKNQTGRIWNAFMWMMLAIGNGWLMVLYAREYFARQLPSDHPPSDPWDDFFVPRTLKIQFPDYFEPK